MNLGTHLHLLQLPPPHPPCVLEGGGGGEGVMGGFPETLEYGASFYVDETFLATIFDEKVLKNSTFKNDEHFDSFQKFSLSPYMVPGRLRGHHGDFPAPLGSQITRRALISRVIRGQA